MKKTYFTRGAIIFAVLLEVLSVMLITTFAAGNPIPFSNNYSPKREHYTCMDAD